MLPNSPVVFSFCIHQGTFLSQTTCFSLVFSYAGDRPATSPLIRGPFPRGTLASRPGRDGKIALLTDSESPYKASSQLDPVFPINLSEFGPSTFWKGFDLSRGTEDETSTRPANLSRGDAEGVILNRESTLAVVWTKDARAREAMQILSIPSRVILATISIPGGKFSRAVFASDSLLGIAISDLESCSLYVLDCNQDRIDFLKSFGDLQGRAEAILGTNDAPVFGLLTLDPQRIHSVWYSTGGFQHQETSIDGQVDLKRNADHFFVLKNSVVSRYLISHKGLLIDDQRFEGVDFEQEAAGHVSESGNVVLVYNAIGESRLIGLTGVLVPKVPAGWLFTSRDGGVCILSTPGGNVLAVYAPIDRTP